MPRENAMEVDSYLDETEVTSRMSHVLHKFALWDLRKLDWETKFED